MNEQMNETPNIFYNTAHLYDMDMCGVGTADAHFILECARGRTGPILELACGTGRITIPIAQAGREIVGLDLSQPMLDVLMHKRAQFDRALQERIQVVQADMADFDPGRTFALIVISFRSFQALADPDRIASCLACIRRHLTDDGLVIIDLYWLRHAMNDSWLGNHVMWVRELKETGQVITRMRVGKHCDIAEQIFYADELFAIREASGTETVLRDPLRLHFYHRHQAETLFCSAGFHIEAEYGGWDRRPIESGSEQIFLLSKARLDSLPRKAT